MADDVTLLIGAVTGGLAGAILTFIGSQIREKRKDKELAKRARVIVRSELTAIRDYLKYVLDSSGTAVSVPLARTAKDFEQERVIIETIQYPRMTIEMKVKAFSVELLAELQVVYLAIQAIPTVPAHRPSGSNVINGFVRQRDEIEKWRDLIDEAIQKLD